MFLHGIIVSFQIASFIIPSHSEASKSTVRVNSTRLYSADTRTIQPTTSSTTTNVHSSSVVVHPTRTAPSQGALQAVLLFVSKMTVSQFEEKKKSFLLTLRAMVVSYCSQRYCAEIVENRKRRETTSWEVYIVTGFPKESINIPGDLLIAFFVSTGENKFLSNHHLLSIVQEHQSNLSRVLGKEIAGARAFTLNEVKTTKSSSGTSLKSLLLYIFFGAFVGVLLILAVCISVACWIGRKEEKKNQQRPLTISSLELVET
ncbi:uncharacterized protein [Montipora foliosa]|uniref:uncharacterized protein isoform X2 n=1 Tax=Montipora foliosa TaxID=591990 RepID=UPI0035F10456